MTNLESPFSAVALQVRCRAVNQCDDEAARLRMLESIAHCEGQILSTKSFIKTFSGDDVRLVVLPEYFLTSFPVKESAAEWISKCCVEPDGAEYEALSKIAEKAAIYLSGNLYETDSNFPELYFQTSFVIDDKGDVILRYRRLISMFAPTPHDLLSNYLDVYGEDALFPVADTPLGRLACIASEEILYPEIARTLALKGAEVICHSSSEVGSPLMTPKNIAKQARAYENMVYIISSNSAGIGDIPFPAESTDGHSQVVDYKGRVLAEAGPGESMCGNAEIDIMAQRRVRAKPAMTNMLARQRLDLFSSTYAKTIYPRNSLLDKEALKAPNRDHFLSTQRIAIQHLKELGVFPEEE